MLLPRSGEESGERKRRSRRPVTCHASRGHTTLWIIDDIFFQAASPSVDISLIESFECLEGLYSMRSASGNGAIAPNSTRQCSVTNKSSSVLVPTTTRLADLFETASALCAVFVGVSAVFHVIRKRRAKKTHADPSPHAQAAFARKREFLAQAGNVYGYGSSSRGFIDTWRTRELPNLIVPLDSPIEIDEPEVYLDYAGAALPTQTQLEEIMKSSCILANPHSNGPAASRTLLLIEQAKKRVMDHLNCHPGRFAGLASPPKSCDPAECHPGYDVVWTSGTTESLRIVAERFPWACCQAL